MDLGCGDGRVLTSAALLKQCRGIGVDVSQVYLPMCLILNLITIDSLSKDMYLSFVFISWQQQCLDLAEKINQAENLRELLSFHRVDLTSPEALTNSPLSSLPPITIIFLYVYPTLLRRIVPLVKELSRKHRARVVTLVYHFEPTEWMHDRTDVEHRLNMYSSES